jgi:hypothetical protein
MTDLTVLAIDWQLTHATREDVRSELTQRRAAHLAKFTHEVTMDTEQPAKPENAASAALLISKRIEQYLMVREKIRQTEARHDEELQPMKQIKEMLEGALMTHLLATGVDSIAARGIGTAYKTTKKSASLADAAAFRRFVIGSEAWDLIDWKANVSAVETFLTEQQQLPPGVNFSQREVVGVRKA